MNFKFCYKSTGLKLRIDVETMKPAEHNTVYRTPVSATEPQKGGQQGSSAVPVPSVHTQSSCPGSAANRILTEEELFRFIASNYLLTCPPSCKDELNDFLTYMKEMRATITGVDRGRLLITVKCDSLEILERLWEDFSSGHLSEMVQRCFVTEEILTELSLAELTLKTTISKEEYESCKMHFNKHQTQGNSFKEMLSS